MAAADMLATAYAKKLNKMYFNERSAMSAQRGN